VLRREVRLDAEAAVLSTIMIGAFGTRPVLEVLRPSISILGKLHNASL
jgi:hypothetical protein